MADDRGESQGSDAPAHEPSTPQRGLAIAMLATGGFVMAGGVIALALDQDDYAAPAGHEQPEYYRDTSKAGIAAIVGGAIVSGFGAYLFLHGRSDRPLAVTPTAGPVAGGAVLGVSTSF